MGKLNEQSMQVIDRIVDRHRGRPGPVKLMLHDVQKELGYIPFEALEKIAAASGVSAAEVYGVVTFYTQFTTEPKGKHVINVCMGTACYVNGSAALLQRICDLTGTKVNQTSADGLFSLDATRCLGACGLAPVAILDDQVYGNATSSTALEDRIKAIIKTESGVH